MRKSFLSISTLALVIVLTGAGCSADTTANTNNGTGGSADNATATTTGAFAITMPATGTEITSPFRIEGTVTDMTIVQGGSVYARLLDKDGEMMVEAKVTPEDSGEFVFTQVYYFSNNGPEVTLELFGKDASGKQLGKSTVPLKLGAK